MTDSSVTRAGTPAYESLTIDTLSGSGTTFILDTDLAGEANSDKVTITHADVGTHYVQIKDLSKLNNIEVTGEHKQLLITDASGKLTFVGKEFNAGGLWDVDPTLSKGDALGLSANDWYLTNMVKTVNNDTSVLLDAADNSYAMWRNTNDSLRSRLGALASGREQADGVWARTRRQGASAAQATKDATTFISWDLRSSSRAEVSMAALSTTAMAAAATPPAAAKII